MFNNKLKEKETTKFYEMQFYFNSYRLLETRTWL